MNMKKKELVIKIDHRLLYTFIVLGILVIIGMGVYAYGTSNPSSFGHSLDEIALPENCDNLVCSQEVGLKYKIINIGDWNMNVAPFAQIPYDIPEDKIRSINVLIRNDEGKTLYPLDYGQGVNGITGTYSIRELDIVLGRAEGFLFDSNMFESTSYNRGWIVIGYVD